jgi:hypothetical protein
VDWYVLLTPLLALGVIALLGFTGCDKLFGLDELDPLTTLTFEARLPSYLAVLETRFEWTQPGTTSGGFDMMPVVTTDGTDTVLTHVISTTAGGTWMMVNCHLKVQDTVEKGDQKSIDGSFVLNPPVDPEVTARFHTTGRPDTKDFMVIWDGRVPM